MYKYSNNPSIKVHPHTTPGLLIANKNNNQVLNTQKYINQNNRVYTTPYILEDNGAFDYNNDIYDLIVNNNSNNNISYNQFGVNYINKSENNDYNQYYFNDNNNNFQINNVEYNDEFNNNSDIVYGMDFNTIESNKTNYILNQNNEIKPLFEDVTSSYLQNQNYLNSLTGQNIQDNNYLLNNSKTVHNHSQHSYELKNYDNKGYYDSQSNKIIYNIEQQPSIIDYNNGNVDFNNYDNIFNNQTYSENKILDENLPGNIIYNDEYPYAQNYQSGELEPIDSIINLPPEPIKKRALEKSDFLNIIYKDVGIINLGNTCFINCCLQVLIHCPIFIYAFFKKIKSLNEINKKLRPISSYFYDVCYAMVDTVNTQERYIDISNFKNEFGLKHPTFGGYMPNDSQEFCRVLLEDLSNELNEIKTKTLYREYTDNEKKSKKIRDEEFDKNFKEREKSIIIDIFYSQIITTFTCECKSQFFSFQKLLDFPILLPENVQTVDIKDLLKTYFKPETIEFGKQCQKCKKVLKHKKEIKISRPPEVLILSLQRINQINQTKNECMVTFPPILDMREFIDHECGFDKQPFYSLYAVTNHTGSIDFGHYYSYIKFQGKNEWYEFNDSSVKKIEQKIESFPYAYALFYIRNKNVIKN